MFLHRSNRAELMLEALADELQHGRARDPLRPECIVVQSLGMARYVALHLAQRFGVWANPRFMFPREVLDWASASAASLGLGQAPPLVTGSGGPTASAATVISPNQLLWAVAAELRDGIEDPIFAELHGYLSQDVHHDRLLQLAERLGGLFDDYAVYREDWIAKWESGAAAQDWQAELWRRVMARLGPAQGGHVAAQLQALLTVLQQGHSLPNFAERLHLFGLSTLPPLYAKAFSALSLQIPVHLFMLSPSREYWTDLTPERDLPRRLRRAGIEAEQAADLHFEVGHRLLASLGAQGRDWMTILEQFEEPRDGDAEHYADPGLDTMLHVVQQDMLNLVCRGRASHKEPPLAYAAVDRSIEVHVCHSPMRELEVLHDQLLWLFERSGVRPEQVVVMAPDIETYAPLISAVFAEQSGRHPIPFRVSDRAPHKVDALFGAVEAVLELLVGRLGLADVLDVLAIDLVRQRFGIGETDLAQVRAWAGASGMRWAADEAHRVEAGQPAFGQNTVRFGLERLLLGASMEGGGLRTFEGRLPLDGFEGGQGELLGRFSAYCETVLALRAGLRAALTVSEFVAFVRELVELCLDRSESTAEPRQALHDALLEMQADAQAAQFAAPVSVGALRRLLLAKVGQRGGGHGFMAGGVTFCQLMPMRSIPFEVVVLLGMDDEGFPRTQRPLTFDKRVQQPQPGDRRLRDDDRYLFLEALLSARQKLLISYVGRGIHDNSVRPPSVLVLELFSLLDDTFEFAHSAEQDLSVHHALSAYSPRYFAEQREEGDAARFCSFASHLLQGARRLQGARLQQPFLAEPLQPEVPPGESLSLSLSQLERYVHHPIRTMLQERLGLYLGQEIAPVQDREPIELDALAKYQVGDQVLSMLLAGQPAADVERATAARGELPLGTPGQLSLQEAVSQARGVARLGSQYMPEPGALAAESFEVSRAGLSVSGTLDHLWSDQQVAVQFGRVGRRSELRLWARHVLCNWLAIQPGKDYLPRRSLLVGRSAEGQGLACVWFAPLVDPESALQLLFSLVVEASCFPLPLCEGPSRAYARANIDRAAGKKVDPIAAAAQEYSRDFGPLDDAYIKLVYPDFQSFAAAQDGAFARLAEQLFGAMLAVREESAQAVEEGGVS